MTTVITSASYTITSSGRYKLGIDITSEGTPITIEADDVDLDLDGHTITGTAGVTADTKGIFSVGYERIRVHNGTITGHHYGLHLSDNYDTVAANNGTFTGGGHIVENLIIDQCKFRGIRVEGNGNIVRNNVIREIGGTTAYSDAYAFGIESYGPGAVIEGNRIYEVRGRGVADIGEGVGISISDLGRGSVIQNNTLLLSSRDLDTSYDDWPAESRSTYGIWVGGDSSDVVVPRNILNGWFVGICIKRMVPGLVAHNIISDSFIPIYLPQLTGQTHPARVADNMTDMGPTETYTGRNTAGPVEYVEANYLTAR